MRQWRFCGAAIFVCARGGGADARQVTLNDFHAFDPSVRVETDAFVELTGRHFRQPAEGLGLDNSPSAHMWRTTMRPTKFL